MASPGVRVETPGGKVLVFLQFEGQCHRFKFFRGTQHLELLYFIRALLALPDDAQFDLLDDDGDPVLLNSSVPSQLELEVSISGDRGRKRSRAEAQEPKPNPSDAGEHPDAEGGSIGSHRRSSTAGVGADQAPPYRETCEAATAATHRLLDAAVMPEAGDLHNEGKLLSLLASTEQVLHLAGHARRRLLDGLGSTQSRRLVFRADVPVHVRQITFGFCTADHVVRLAEVSRGFLAWVSSEGRRIVPVVDDRLLNGGPEAAVRIAARVHPNFVSSVMVERESLAACAFLDALVQQEIKSLGSLQVVIVPNTQYVPASLLIRLLRQAGSINHVELLTRLDRPLPSECLASVRCLMPLVLHATELHGFPSLFLAQHNPALRRVVFRDTAQLDFRKIHSTFPEVCPQAPYVEALHIEPHGEEPAGRCWERWIQALPALLGHPALAAIELAAVPVASDTSTGAGYLEALCQALGEQGLPPKLRTLVLLPYETTTRQASSGVTGTGEPERRIRELLSRSRQDWHPLEIRFPGMQPEQEPHV